MRSRLVILSAGTLAILFAYWRLGIFEGFPAPSKLEVILLLSLLAYALIGVVGAFRGHWHTVSHVARVMPLLGIICTGIGLFAAAGSLHPPITPAVMVQAFQGIVYSLIANITAVALMTWLIIVSWWTRHVDI